MVSAWAADNGLVLGQIKVNEKSNEITAIPELLRALELSGCIVTIDAMGCKKTIATESLAELVVTGGDATEVFDFVEKAFDPVALTIALFVVVNLKGKMGINHKEHKEHKERQIHSDIPEDVIHPAGEARIRVVPLQISFFVAFVIFVVK